MTTTLDFGNGLSCALDSERIIRVRAAPSTSLSNTEIVAHLRAALAAPIGYPPLALATVPGDRVTLALGPGLPSSLAIAEGALAALQDAGVESSRVSVVAPHGFSEEAALREALPRLGVAEQCLTIHDPDDPNLTQMLGVARTGQAIRLNRRLCEADLVLPVCMPARGDDTDFENLFPHFSDRATVDRLEAPLIEPGESARQEHRQEITEAGWLLGIGTVVQVVPGPGGSVVYLQAGESAQVGAECEQRYRETWSCTPARGADLVIATLVGGPGEQTWKNLGRALRGAASLLNKDGSIAIYSTIVVPPGEAFEALVDNEDYDLAEREIVRDGRTDGWSAWQLCRALRDGPVYLRSNLPEKMVESLGVTPITGDHELDRLVQNHDATVVLEQAQHALPSIGNP
ncbi:MAG: lactate racemase domain-containing protein [Pirellulales bacterium]|nr:lactate racemase domain-containing protein [Pirellulales bacterium]